MLSAPSSMALRSDQQQDKEARRLAKVSFRPSRVVSGKRRHHGPIAGLTWEQCEFLASNGGERGGEKVQSNQGRVYKPSPNQATWAYESPSPYAPLAPNAF